MNFEYTFSHMNSLYSLLTPDLTNELSEAPVLPQRPRSAGYNTLPPPEKPKPTLQRLPSKSSCGSGRLTYNFFLFFFPVT